MHPVAPLAAVAAVLAARPAAADRVALPRPLLPPAALHPLMSPGPRFGLAVRRVALGPPAFGGTVDVLLGAWTCRGPGGAFSIATTLDPDLGGAWVRRELGPYAGAGRRVEYRTLDAVAKVWTRFVFTPTGARLASTSSGPPDPATPWTWDWESPDVRDHERYDGHGGLALWSELHVGATCELHVGATWVGTAKIACKAD